MKLGARWALRPETPAWPSLVALFLASLVVIHGWSGDSPALWLDTLNDQREVRRCVLDGSCSLVGQGASIPGLFVAGGWLHARALLFRLGLGLDGVHLLIQGLDALGVALVALAGYRLGGRLLGALAAFVLVGALGELAATRPALYNTSPLAFLGAVLLLACVAAVERPGLVPSVVTALLAAVMADIHACCAAAGVTVVWVALLPAASRPLGRRVLQAAVAAAVFAAAAFALAPLMWVENVRFAWHGGSGGAHAPVSFAAVASVFYADEIARYAAFGVGAWLLAIAARRASLRRALDVPAALAVPLLVAFFLALRHGLDDSGGKYLAHIKPAAALGVAAPLAALATALVTALVARIPALRRSEPWAARLTPWLSALAILVTTRHGIGRDPRRFVLFSMRDVDAFARVLRDERGWSRARVLRRVKAAEQSVVLLGLLDESAVAWRDGRDDDDDFTEATLLHLDVAELPDPLPQNWTVARRSAARAAVIVFTRSWLDWQHFELCAEGAGERRCVHDADVQRGSTAQSSPDGGQMVLRVPLRPASASAPEAPSYLFMPRVLELCGGRVAALSGAGSRIEADGRHAVLTGGPGELSLIWELKSPECPAYFAGLQTPFFVEADQATAAALEAVMRRREP
jgi:hypothetical protein